MCHHLAVLLYLRSVARQPSLFLLAESRMCPPFHISSRLSSDPSHSFIYPFHLFLFIVRPKLHPSHLSLSYYRPTQVTPSYPFHFFIYSPASISSSKFRVYPLSLAWTLEAPALFSLALLSTRSSIPSLFRRICPGLRPFVHHDLHAVPAYYITTSFPQTLRLERNSIRNIIHLTRDTASGLFTTHLMPLYAL
ncbi:uncharacterized protein EDB93DRAFT_1150610 [Suillus bovinus]|uniref:uncharacterized protein n=1 Tax=Suillus bovinus TaxID=48563 RepID=UPI001B87200C|nr:uncharacterized protein EDB93DRAFT_1150610 [Suillus bovinus]KAG2146028.1 hypothetical protein EDB93DRAFT_1150610 [Suillus bovinus]